MVIAVTLARLTRKKKATMTRRFRPRTALAVAAAVVTAGALLASPASASISALPTIPTPARHRAAAADRDGGPGAKVPFTEYEAENARTNGIDPRLESRVHAARRRGVRSPGGLA